MEISKHQITLNVGQSYYQAAYWEAGQGSPVLFLHGFMGKGDCWQPLIPYLQSQNRCICLDMLGFGDSAKPMIRYDIAQLVRFVRAFVEALQIDPCIVVGYSLGGWVAAAYALAHSHSVDRLILLAPAGIRDDSFCGRYNHLRPLLWQTPLIDWVLGLAKPLAIALGKQQELEGLSRIRRELNAQPAARSFLVDRMRPEDAIDTVEKEIHRLQIPTLVITGDRDETIPLWHSQTYASEIPDARLAIIPGANHDLPQTYAPQLADVMLPFLNQGFVSAADYDAAID